MRRHIKGVTRFASKGPVLNLCSVSYPTPCALVSMLTLTIAVSFRHRYTRLRHPVLYVICGLSKLPSLIFQLLLYSIHGVATAMCMECACWYRFVGWATVSFNCKDLRLNITLCASSFLQCGIKSVRYYHPATFFLRVFTMSGHS